MSTPTPKFLYFDLGNVLLHFDHELACRQMADVTEISVDQVRGIVFESDLQSSYERGEITCRRFYESFCEQSKTCPNFEALKLAASSIFEVNKPVEVIVRKLASLDHRLGILSNTCRAHWEYVSRGRYPLVNEPFGVYSLSFELQSMKPDAKIYRAAAELAECRPEEIFFVDDREENVQGALEAGYDAVLYTTAESLVAALRQRGVNV